MKATLQQVLAIAQERGCAIPAFNVYNLETLMGVMDAARETGAPVIFQMYSRLFNGQDASLMAPAILEAIQQLETPAVFHLDHGATLDELQRAMRSGATGIMLDGSAHSFAENVAVTRHAVELCAACGVGVEGELGHVGTTKDAQMADYTSPDEAKAFAEQTGVAALAILVGTAHGHYKQAPVLDIPRIRDIKAATGLPLVLHGGSGVPDDQIRMAVEAGIRKVNFGTDVCCSFLDGVFAADRGVLAVDLFMREPVKAVKAFAIEKIKLLGADRHG